MNKLLRIGAIAISLFSFVLPGKAEDYVYVNQETSLTAAQSDRANWMKYLPDNMFVAHLSVPGTHDTFTAGVSIFTASSAQAQSADFSSQLNAGFRCFDIRPGWSSSKAMCMHGVASCNTDVNSAFSQMKTYLDAHPTEMFFIHMFKANTTEGDSNASNLASAMKNLLNPSGTYGDYIINFDPMLKVGDCRGKIILFMRDNLFYLGLTRAGNMTNWTMQFYPTNPTKVTNASNPRNYTILHAQDVSSPYNGSAAGEDDQDAEERFCKALFDYARNQASPNDNPTDYVPFFVMNLTSGEGGGKSGRAGYRANAKIMTPIAIEKIRNSWTDGSAPGPTGMIFSDYVLDNSYCGVNTVTGESYSGTDLVNTIIDNNFKYCDRFKLTNPETFVRDWSCTGITEDIFGSAEYYLYNVGMEKFLEPGKWWGTHALVGETGICVSLTPHDSGGFTLSSTCRRDDSNHYLSKDDPYLDQSDTTPWDFKYANLAERVFNIYFNSKGLGANAGSVVVHESYSTENPNFQWKVMSIAERIETLASASPENPMDATFLVRGAKFFQHDTDRDNWNINTPETGSSTKYKATSTLGTYYGGDDGEGILHFTTPSTSSSYKDGASWSVANSATNLPPGNYQLEFNAVSSTPLTMTVNGQSVTVASNVAESSISSASSAVTFINNANNAYKHTIALKILDGNISINISKSNSVYSTTTASAFKDFKLTYYGETKEIVGDYVVHTEVDLNANHGENHIALDPEGTGYAANSLFISDNHTHDLPYDVNSATTSYQRPVSAANRNTGWHALYLPFDVDDWTQIATRVITFTGVNTTASGDVLVFEDVPASSPKLYAKTLYLAQVDYDFDIQVSDRTVYKRPVEDTSVTYSSATADYTLTGNFDLKTGLKTLGVYALSGQNFMRASSDDVVLKPFRAYLSITPKGGAKAPSKVSFVVEEKEEETDAIDAITIDQEGKKIYNLKGQPVKKPTTGVYVIDGAKVLIK